MLSDPRYGSNLNQVGASVKKHEAISADILAREESWASVLRYSVRVVLTCLLWLSIFLCYHMLLPQVHGPAEHEWAAAEGELPRQGPGPDQGEADHGQVAGQ